MPAGDKDAVPSGTPRNIWEAAERGTTGFIIRLVERNVEFNINQRVRAGRLSSGRRDERCAFFHQDASGDQEVTHSCAELGGAVLHLPSACV